MNAELLLIFTLDRDRAYLYAHPERELTDDEAVRYEAALSERARGVPAQYITGHQEFWGMDLIVSPAVLIPRPETEHVVETVLELHAPAVSGHFATNEGLASEKLATNDRSQPALSERSKPKGLTTRIIDVGTGSGAIALALAKELPDAEIHATDISDDALEIARANAARHALEKRIRFHHADLLEGIASGFDLVVSNPPYVGESEEDAVQFEVRKFEPRHAVFAGPTGTEVIARLIPQASAALVPGGWLVMEISGTIAEETKSLLRDWEEVSFVPDLQSIPRVVKARKSRR